MLSQRNIVNRKAWDALMAKYEAGEYVDGVGKEAVKGGLIADVEGVRAFVPRLSCPSAMWKRLPTLLARTSS